MKVRFRRLLARGIGAAALIAFVLGSAGCATQTKNIATAMFVGAAAGAIIGNQFKTDEEADAQTRNTIVSAIVLSLVAGGLMEWHYQELEAETERLSGQYARYRLCDPENMPAGIEGPYDQSRDEKSEVYKINESQVSKFALFLDDNTKWAFPTFRKRYLPPDRGETQLTSERYMWEIIRPGSFVTRSQNPEYFIEPEKKK